ncbi:replication initiator protein A [Paenibacillus agricola]|uniref:RepB family plasmid replication initiator protein n=1 Tax=Paenibacillus agricola TaxID=2716264 RepID=A0ABX0JJN9_9BACL|nr:replication initiator protein A [Paenibacillus agricola]NHN35581.1 RepB family plasmid replication initiator protein [Paenibacillus agricola]
MGQFDHIESILELLAKEYQANRHLDALKAAALQQETIERLGATLNRQVQAKTLFMYANEQGDSLKSLMLMPSLSAGEKSLLQIKIDILEQSLRVKSSDYMKELVAINTNIAQHALFSANPKSVAAETTSIKGVRSVIIKSKNGVVLNIYDARTMGAVQSLWMKNAEGNSPVVRLKYTDILNELGLTDGSSNYNRVQQSLLRLWETEVTLTQYQRSKNSGYEQIAFTRLIDSIVFERQVGSSGHFKREFEIRLPDWLIQANRKGDMFDISLLLMNDLKSYLAQGLYWLISSYTDSQQVTIELSVLAGHFHFLDEDGKPTMPAFKIVERISQACEELKQIGFIDHYKYQGKASGLKGRALEVTKNHMFTNLPTPIDMENPKQLELELFEE